MYKIMNFAKTVFLAIALSFGLSYVYAWTAPTATPPGGNVSAPINTSSTLQQKSGDFTVANFLANTVTVGGTINANAITAPQFCIGASCVSSWGVQSVNAGTGISIAGTPTNPVVNATGGIPAGAVMFFNLASCPSGWVAANGTGGTPDLRGEFIRGLSNGRAGVDAGRTLGSAQAEDFKSHTHTVPLGVTTSPVTAVLLQPTVQVSTLYTTLSAATGGIETRPRNVALLACVKS